MEGVAHPGGNIGQGNDSRGKEMLADKSIDEGGLPALVLAKDNDVEPVVAETIFGDCRGLGRQADLVEHLSDRGKDVQEIIPRLPQAVLRRGCNPLNSIAGFYPFAHDESLSPNSVEGAGRGDVVL